jgi:hypothetical protein
MSAASSAASSAYRQVVVHLAGGRQDELNLITRVVEALERAGSTDAAARFAELATLCVTDDELLGLIDCYVTVI